MAKSNGEISGWTGWIVFAALMLFVLGAFHAIAGFVALFKTDVVFDAATNSAWVLTYDQWGWIHILGGLLAIWAGSSLMQGNAFGRIIALTVAVISAIANMAFVPVYPFWSLLLITIDILIIYAVTVHGGEMKELQ